MITEQLEERCVAGADKGEKVVSEFFAERLLGPFRPDGVVARVGAGSELGQCGAHIGEERISGGR